MEPVPTVSSASYNVDGIVIADKLGGIVQFHSFFGKEGTRWYHLTINNVSVCYPNKKLFKFFDIIECTFEKLDRYIKFTFKRENEKCIDYLEYREKDGLYIDYPFFPKPINEAEARALFKTIIEACPLFDFISVHYNRMGIMVIAQKGNQYTLFFQQPSSIDKPLQIIPSPNSFILRKGKTSVEDISYGFTFRIEAPKKALINNELAHKLCINQS
jgi:hypothetical protein